jgi:hypothetical protein
VKGLAERVEKLLEKWKKIMIKKVWKILEKKFKEYQRLSVK